MAKIVVKGQPKKNTGILIYIAVILLSAMFIYFGNKFASTNMTAFNQTVDMVTEKALITDIISVEEQTEAVGDSATVIVKDITFKAEILTGNLKGEIVEGVQNFNSYFKTASKEVEIEDKVILYQVADDQESINWIFGEYSRTDALIILGIIFMVLLILLGNLKGLQTLLSISLRY